MLTKEKLKAHIDAMPDLISLEDLIERLIFIEKLEFRIEESNIEEQLISEENLKVEMNTWFK